MPRYDGRQLVENIERLIAGTPLSSIPSPFLHAPEPATDEPDSEGGDSDSQASTVRALSLSIFPALRQHQRVDTVPAGTRLAFMKKVLMRVMRVVSGPQAAFNYFVYSALEVAAQHLDAVRRRLIQLEGTHRRDKTDTEVKLAGMHQGVEVLETRLSEELLALRASVNMTLEKVGSDMSALETRLGQIQSTQAQAQAEQARVLATQTQAHAQMQARVDEFAREGRKMTETVLQSSRDMVESIWKGLEERDVQILNTTRGVQTCHVQINKLEHDTREAQARLLVLNEQINIQLDALERLRRRHLEEKHPEHLRAAGVEVSAATGATPAPPQAPSSASLRVETAPVAPPPSPGEIAPEPAAQPKRTPPPAAESVIPSLESHQVDLAYLRFQRQFRGDEAMLRERQQRYVELILDKLGVDANVPKGADRRRLLDLACGDGVFLDLWRNRPGWEVHGVDLSAAMTRLGRNAGLSIEQADAFAHLESGPEKAWDVITSFQFIEHLDMTELVRLMRDCKRALKPGGLLLFETLNPHAMISHKWFHLDLTHKRLVFPEIASLLLESLGMRVIEATAISEVHESEKLQLLGDARLQANFDRLNEFLFGKQDYYILAQRP